MRSFLAEWPFFAVSFSFLTDNLLSFPFNVSVGGVAASSASGSGPGCKDVEIEEEGVDLSMNWKIWVGRGRRGVDILGLRHALERGERGRRWA
jgi:hypothetical protein